MDLIGLDRARLFILDGLDPYNFLFFSGTFLWRLWSERCVLLNYKFYERIRMVLIL